jgi:hypothetical protein
MQPKEKPVMQCKSRVKTLSLTAIIGCAALFSVGPSEAQQPIAPTGTLEAGPATIVDAQPNYVMEQPLPRREIPFRPTMDRSDYDAAKARANFYGPRAAKPFTEALAPLTAPVIRQINFNAHSETEGMRPPDTHGAVGTTHFVQVTNSHIDMWTRQNSGPLPLAKSVTLATFFGYTTEALFDPRVVYDSTWNRWIVTADAFAESSTVQRLFIAVSTTADPTGLFFIYNLNVTFSVNDFYDFPQLGIDQDAVLFTANIFNGTSFHGADFFAVAKARLYNGLGFSVPVFTGLVGTLAPPIVRDQNSSTFLIAAPPSGTTFSKYTATNTSKGTTLTGPVSITVPSYSVPPGAHQPGTSGKLLDTSDSRFVNASTQSGNDLWQTHTIALGGFPAPKFYRVNTSANTVSQSGFYFASATSDDFNASIAANDAGDCFVTWTSTDTSAARNAQVRLSAKRNADAGISAGPTAFTSSTFYHPSLDNPERWGDYSAVTTDPLNAANAWLVNEKVNSGGLLWGSRIVRFGF